MHKNKGRIGTGKIKTGGTISVKDYLLRLIASKEAEADELRSKVNAAETADEVRGLGVSVTKLQQEIAEARAELLKIQETEVVKTSAFNPSEARNTAHATSDKKNEARNIGEHFRNEASDQLSELRGGRFTVSTSEYRANTDPHVTGGPDGVFGPILTTVDRTIVQEYRRPTITSLFGTGSISGQAITYFVEGAREGNFATVPEAGQKPQIHYANPTTVTDALSKIAGWIRISDEMMSDLDFVVSEINGRLLYDLSLVEETQVLSGDGSAPNLQGLLNRSGVQSLTYTTDLSADDLFKAITLIQNATGLSPDGIAINPTDYEALRLSKDSNGQYFGGGFFQGQYGNGGMAWQPPIWGLRTVVSAAVAAGSPIVGAFNVGATVYTKGGVRVEATNSNENDFTKNLVTIRAEKRVALAVRRPSAFVVVSKA